MNGKKVRAPLWTAKSDDVAYLAFIVALIALGLSIVSPFITLAVIAEFAEVMQ